MMMMMMIVGRGTHLHGFTSVFAIFRQRSWQPPKAEE